MGEDSGVRNVCQGTEYRKEYGCSGNVERFPLTEDHNYKMEAYLTEYTPDYQVVRRWHMYGCWCSDVTEGEFNNESNDKRTCQAEIQYDYAIPELPDEMPDMEKPEGR